MIIFFLSRSNGTILIFVFLLIYRVIANGDKLYDNAILKYKEGDEELAYVYFMRAIQLYQNARQCRDYKEKNDKKYVRS